GQPGDSGQARTTRDRASGCPARPPSPGGSGNERGWRDREYGKHELANNISLGQLRGYFVPRAWFELPAGIVAGADGACLLGELAKLWQVDVCGSADKQFAGGGLEGQVIGARPNSSFLIKEPPE